MASIIFKAIIFITILVVILYLIFSIWIHDKQVNNEPVNDSITNTAFWLAIVLVIWLVGVLIWLGTTFLNKKVTKKLADAGNAMFEDETSSDYDDY
uniref:Uncharacterized protein n=1 Tax=Pithovirus LCPAC406 TaxID=2506599 RepID=A0A481ZCW0_9VIRU|nr:MAG: uncharacterized protein LCPAC406_00970 [Pithovirus LCPAC406]